MSNTPFKKAFDDVAPDVYMETRILANIKDKRKKPFPIKGVLSGVVVLALVIGCFGGIHYNNSKHEYVDRPFSIMVVDASQDIPITEEIGTDTLTFPSFFIEVTKEENEEGNPIGTVSGYDDGGFAVTGDDIDSVQYKSENGSFVYFDMLKMEYDMQNQNFYQVIIPVANEYVDEVNQYINESMMNPETTALKKYIEHHDVAAYFDDEVNLADYWVYFGKECDYLGPDNNSQNYAFFLYNTDNYSIDYVQNSVDFDSNEITVKMYPVSTEYMSDDWKDALKGYVTYFPDTMPLTENPDMKYSELPEDEITIIATYKDGKKAKKVVSVSFNDEGYAQFAFK
ncbi:MAG: hypothetical protein K2L19_09290 [Eubacterium sp.]|nr:hypothetical protein [Eubacterium sp.]